MGLIISRTKGLEALRMRLAHLPATAAAAAQDSLQRVAEQLAETVRDTLGASSATRSISGDPSDDDQRSINDAVRIETDRQGNVSVTVDLPDAAALEFGTLRHPARPFLRPAALAYAAEARRRLADHLRKALYNPGETPP